MPVDTNLKKEGMIYQREQYAKGGFGKKYWDYRDSVALKYVHGNRILDIGCGEGITLERLIKSYPDSDITGIDSELENIDICRKHRLPIQYGTVYDLPIASASIDCVLFFEVIEHLDEPINALKEISRVLKPNGRIIFIFPNDVMFMISRIITGMIKEAFYDSGHVRQWSPSKIRKVLKSTGFRIHVQHSIPFFFWFMSLHHVVVAIKGCQSS